MQPRIITAIDSLKRFPGILQAVLDGLSTAQLKFRPEDDAWSILEIMGHLVDEEKLDFPTRIQLTLNQAEWPPIDPVGWASTHSYQEQTIGDQLSTFQELRNASVQWALKLELSNEDLSQGFDHPKLGMISVGDLLFSWVAHDLLHLRQITKRLYQQNELDSGVYQISYAGQW